MLLKDCEIGSSDVILSGEFCEKLSSSIDDGITGLIWQRLSSVVCDMLSSMVSETSDVINAEIAAECAQRYDTDDFLSGKIQEYHS